MRRWRLARCQGGGQWIASGQGGGDAERGRRPVTGVGIETPQNYVLHGRVEVLHQARGTHRRRLCVQPHQLGERRGLKRAFAGKYFIEHQAERVEVALDADFLAGELFGRHVGGGAVADFGALHLRGQAGEAEIRDQDVAAAIQHDVGRFQIAVQHAAIMGRSQARAELARNLEPFYFGQAADAAQQRSEILAIHVFHRQVRLAFDVAQIVNTAHVGMRNLPAVRISL